MANLHEDDAPDYEGEEEDEEQEVAVNEVVESIKPSTSTAGGDGETESEGEEKDQADKKGVVVNQPKDAVTKCQDGKANDDVNKPKDASRGYRGASKMDRALDAPRESAAPANNNNNNQQDGNNGRGRDSRWGERNNNNNHNNNGGGGGSRRGAMKRRDEESDVGVYIPPAKRRMLEEEEQRKKAKEDGGGATIPTAAADSTTINDNNNNNKHNNKKEITPPIHIQRQTWENLQRTINGTINRLSPSTIKPLIHSLFSSANLIRGRGILTKSILRASTASPQYAPAYASLMAVINTKLPEVGELLLTRTILTFRNGYKHRNRNVVSCTLALLGHLFNQGLAHELLSLQILTVLLDGNEPTEDSVDVAVEYMCIVGQQLSEVSPTGVHAVMERFRALLHEGSVGRRAQYRIETLLKIKKGKFKDYPTIPDEENLDLVEREEQITFELGLDDEGLSNEEELDYFRYDEEYNDKEGEWRKIKVEILGEDDSSSGDDGSGSGSGSGSESDSDNEEEAPDQQLADSGGAKKTVIIEDLTETDLVHLRRTIYLTIMSSATFEECTHKLAKMDIPPGRESELINMIIECCSQERTFLRYYGLVSGRFCLLHERWQTAFEEAFATQYNTIHRLETNKLRNVAKLFGHLLHTDSVSWSVLGCIHLNEDETTSSSRIFIKILVQEMAEAMGMVTLKQRFDTDNPEPDGAIGEDSAAANATSAALTVANGRRGGQQHETSSREWFKGMFPKDNARNTRYAINFFTSIGLGPLTDGMREFLKNAPKLILLQAQASAAREAAQKEKDDDESSVISTSSSDTSSASSSSSSSSGTSSSSGSYTSSSSSSYSSDSRNRRRKDKHNQRGRGRKRGGGRRRSRSYSSSSSSFSGSDSSPDRRKRKQSSKKKAKRSNSRDREDLSNQANTGTGSKRRSVSESPRRGRDRKKRSRSSSYSSSSSRFSGKSSKKKDSRLHKREKHSRRAL